VHGEQGKYAEAEGLAGWWNRAGAAELRRPSGDRTQIRSRRAEVGTGGPGAPSCDFGERGGTPWGVSRTTARKRLDQGRLPDLGGLVEIPQVPPLEPS